MSIHNGHRARVKQEFMSGGLAHFSDHRALELLLFYSRLQGDVNPLAHHLLNTFGSLSGVLDANPDDLRAVPGIGENTVTLLKLIPAICGKYVACRSNPGEIIQTTKHMDDLFRPYFFGARNETFYLAALDGKRKLLGVRKLSEGTPDSTDILNRHVAEATLSLNATAVIIAHNHVSNVALPSQTDLTSTSFIQDFLERMSVTLVDHLIMVDDDMLSLRESCYLR